jgi:isoamylase
VLDNSFVLCFNAHQEPIEFVLPGWRVVVYTGAREALLSQELAAAAKFTVDAHTAVVVQAVSKAQSNPGGLNTR